MEDKDKTQAGNTSSTATNEDKEGNEGNQSSKTFTQDELNKVLSERLAKEQAKFRKDMESTIAKERQEAERMAKLSADEKEKELTVKQKEANDKRERDLKIRENKLDAVDKLIEAGVSTKLVDFLVDQDPDVTMERVGTFTASFKEEVHKAVELQLKGTNPPKDLNSANKTQNGTVKLTL